MTRHEFAPLRPVRVFDLVDGFAADRGLDGTRPRPLGEVQVRVLGITGAVTDWAEPGTLVLRTTSDGFRVYLGRLEFGAAARRRVRRMDLAGHYRLRVNSDYYERVDLPDVELPDPAVRPTPYAVRLTPGPRYPFQEATIPAPTRAAGRRAVAPVPGTVAVMRGTLRSADRQPIEGAEVRYAGMTATTIATGDWIFVLPPGGSPPASGTVLDVTLPGPGRRRSSTTYDPPDTTPV
ncbi:hypothetical protein AB0H36_41745 [Kribbella sp. NPDC050820]|uniref:hypothetical protein n=1 Tax=Kribbella sp. NPDC050820 TaxID=3155408 RepID=UPI003405F85F